MPHSRLYLAVENFRVWLPFDVQDTDESSLSPRQRVIDEGIVAGEINLKLSDDRATCGDRYSLDAPQRLGNRAAKIVDLVEYLSDNVER